MNSLFHHGQTLKLLQIIAMRLVGDAKIDAMDDLTLRQLAILLTVYLDSPPHTIRGLAKKLSVTKPVITRALDSMGKHHLISRRRDESDRRNMIIQRTVAGALYIERLSDMVMKSMEEATSDDQPYSGPSLDGSAD